MSLRSHPILKHKNSKKFDENFETPQEVHQNLKSSVWRKEDETAKLIICNLEWTHSNGNEQ